MTATVTPFGGFCSTGRNRRFPPRGERRAFFQKCSKDGAHIMELPLIDSKRAAELMAQGAALIDIRSLAVDAAQGKLLALDRFLDQDREALADKALQPLVADLALQAFQLFLIEYRFLVGCGVFVLFALLLETLMHQLVLKLLPMIFS